MDASENPNLNAVCLQNAVLCADCEVISNSPHDTCCVCGSRSLLSLSCVLGGTLQYRGRSWSILGCPVLKGQLFR